MVFEAVVTDVINKFLGDYVENLDKKQLKIGIWGGDVVLYDLKLRENALDDLDLPVELIYGYLGKLVLKIPWKNLYSQPVIAQVDNLFALVTPRQAVKYDSEKQEKYDRETKQAALSAFEESWKKKKSIDQQKPDATFAEKLTAQIVNNLQIKISNVHIRYEDSFTTGKPFAFGISLHDLEIYTTDINWIKCYMTDQCSRVHKVANLDCLSVYMNCNADLIGSHNTEMYTDLFKDNIAQKDVFPKGYSYILGPISLLAKLQLNTNPELDDPPFNIPKVELGLEMEKLHVGLTSSQFQDVLKLADAMNRMQLGAPYRKFRPFNIPYKGNYKTWWKFAITCIRDNISKRNKSWNWIYIKEHRELCNTYAQKHKEKELSKKPSATLLESCALLESKLDLFNLLLIRQRVQIDVDKIKSEELVPVKAAGWFSGWFSGNKTEESLESPNLVKQFEAAMTPEEKAKLYKAIGYQENVLPLDYPEDYVAIKMNFTLIALEIVLYDDIKEIKRDMLTLKDEKSLETVMLLKFSMANCTILQRPSSNGLCVIAGMKEMRLTGIKRNGFEPTLIESKFIHQQNLLDIFFETNPVDKLCDQRIKIRARPLYIIYDSDTILRLISAFTPPRSVNLSELEGAATAQMANFKERSATGMQYMIEKRSILDVDVEFMPNVLILPEFGTFNPGKQTLVVVSLGQLRVKAKPRDTHTRNIASMFSEGQNQSEILKSIMEKAYDNYNVSIDDIQLLVSRSNEPWDEILQNGQISEIHILRPTSIIVEIRLCVVDDDPRLAKTKVNILLPSIDINITEERIFDALNVFRSLPLPEGEVSRTETLKKSISNMSLRKSLPNFLTQDRRSSRTERSEKVLIEEIIQYTSLELNFALNEIKIALYKTSSLCNIVDSPESTKFGTPIEEAVSVEEFHDTEREIQFSSRHTSLPMNSFEQKIVLIQILQVEASMAQRTYETVAIAKLGAINLTQYDYLRDEQHELFIISTPKFSEELQYLLTVTYKMADKKSPEFTTKYNSTEQLINIHFSTLNITLHLECLQYLLTLVDSLQKKFDSATSDSLPKDRVATAADESIVGKLAVILEEDGEVSNPNTIVNSQEAHRRVTKSTKVVNSIKIHIIANLEQLAVLLTCRKRPLATLQVQQFNSGVVIKSSYTELNLRLKDILVNDMNPKNIHTNILSIVGRDALNCQIVMYNLNETCEYNANDMKISIEIGCMKIVFLNWFVTNILKFVSNFQAAQRALANASAAAADAAMQNAKDAYVKASRMKLNINIKAPVIVVPVDSQSFNAVVLDLGSLVITNSSSEISIPDNNRSPAVIDKIRLEMRNLKLSKASILQIHDQEAGIHFDRSLDTTDLAYGLKSDVNILNPVNFVLNINRNLSSSWYKDIPELDLSGRLESIEFNVFVNDYGLLMSILKRNLNEGKDEFPNPEEQQCQTSSEVTKTKSEPESPSKVRSSISPKVTNPVIKSKEKVQEQIKFNFQFDGVVANFMHGPKEGFAQFAIYFLSVKGSQLFDGTISTSIVLCNIQIDDTRNNTNGQIKQYLCRKDWNTRLSVRTPTDLVDECHSDVGYMLDLTAIVKENDTFAEIRVSGFDLILCIDFLLKLADFCVIPEDTTPLEFYSSDDVQMKAVEAVPKPSTSRPGGTVAQNISSNNEKEINIVLRVDEPDIILVENLEDVNTNAIVFNAEAQLNYRMIGEKQIINGRIEGLKMFMCSFQPERRESTKHYIIHPCVISLQGSTPENEGLHISLNLSEIIINVSPATIELFNKALRTINSNNTEISTTKTFDTDFSDIWTARKFVDKDYWFVKIEEGKDALADLECENFSEMKIKSEKCIIEVPCITLVVESGVGYYTTPLISVDTKLNAVISDWSRDVAVNGSLSLNVSYYNEALAVWEPIIEPNEHLNRFGEKEYLPWELSFNMSVETNKNEFDESCIEKTSKIKVRSEENLEITMSRTFLTIIEELSDAFTQAIDSKGLIKPEVIAPYVVENDTGFNITINLSRGIFTLHECHMPNQTVSHSLNRALIFQSDNSNFLVPDQVKECEVSPGGKVYLQTRDLSTLTHELDEENEKDAEYIIYVKIGDIQKEICLPVSKSDKRYFPLTHTTNNVVWGIVSEVFSEYGTTKVNIHGIVNVENHFATNVNIYSKSTKNQEKKLVGTVPPGDVYHVPLHAIYTDDKEFWFSLNDYKVSIQGIKWNDCPTDLYYSRQLQCDPINDYESLYINAIRVKTEIFYENTNKFKIHSAFYSIHLRPPLYLRNALPINIKVSVAGCSVHRSGIKTVDATNVGSMSSVLAKEELLDYGEKEVLPGDCLHLPTVKLCGKTSEINSFLVVKLIDYLEKDWSCTTEVNENFENVAATWRFSSYDSSAKMEMDLLARYENRNGSLMVTLYSPFWMINKTGLMLSYKTDMETVDVLYHPPELSGPILFSFREKFFFDKKSASIRIDSGEWSDKIPLDVAGSIGSVICKANDLTYQIGVHNHLTHNSLTKQITFIPFFIATNKCYFPILLQELSRPGDPWIEVNPNSCTPLWPKNDSDHMVVAKVEGHCTAPFKYSEELCTLLQLEKNTYGGINVDIQTTEGGIYINFTEYKPGDAPGLLINHTLYPIVYYEKGTMEKKVLEPKNRVLFAWQHTAGEKIILFGKNNVESDLRRDGVGELIVGSDKHVFWVSFLDGLQRILLFTELEEIAKKSESSALLQQITQSLEIRIHGIGLSVVDNENGLDILYLGITSSGIIWESKKDTKKRFKQLNIHDTAQIEMQYQQYLIDKGVNRLHTYFIDNKYQIDFDRMILNKNGSRSIQRTFLPGVWISMKTSPYQTQLHAKINKIQLDNQLNDPIFPVVLAPIAPPKSVATTTSLKPFIECSVVQRVVPNSNVKQFKYCSMLIQEFHFKVDLLFLTAIANMFTGKVSDEQAAKLFNENVESITKPLSDLVATHSLQEQKNFYDNLHLGPLKIHVSFSMAGSDTTALPGILSTLVQGVGVTLTDVNDVVFRLAFFEREFRFFTQQQLVSEVSAHYTGQALKQLYVLVLGLDVLGNPYGLVVGLKKGVEDLFYEPFQGAIQGPGEFAEGLVLGVKSLFGHTVGGAAGAVSKITGAMGKGLAALTFDDDYQKKRRQAINKKPKNFQEGIARSSKGLVMGFVDGVTGVVAKPYTGAKEEGVEGFFKGLGKGALGLVARPTAGIVDFASGSFEAVKRATESSDDVTNLRPARFLHHDSVLRPYSLAEARGNKMLKEIEKGKYATTDNFIHCEEVINKQEYLLLSNHRILYISKNDVFRSWTVQWTCLWKEINSIVKLNQGLQIILQKQASSSIFSSSSAQKHTIMLSSTSHRDRLEEIMKSQLQDVHLFR